MQQNDNTVSTQLQPENTSIARNDQINQAILLASQGDMDEPVDSQQQDMALQSFQRFTEAAKELITRLVSSDAHVFKFFSSFKNAAILAHAAAVVTITAQPDLVPVTDQSPTSNPLDNSNLPSTSSNVDNQENPNDTPVKDDMAAHETSSNASSSDLVVIPEKFLPLPQYRALSSANKRDREVINCTVCSKRIRRGSMREHLDRHNNTGKFSCPICDKTFSRESAMEKHIRTHTGERPFKCTLCAKAYKQQVHLNEHMRSHTGIRPYICRLCGFSLASKSLLTRHLKTHGVKKPVDIAQEFWFKTDAPKEEVLQIAARFGEAITQHSRESEVGVTSTSDQSLDQSQLDSRDSIPDADRLIVTARKYLCNICPAGFPNMQALRSHRVTTHDLATPHNCSSCNEGFASKKMLKLHLRVKHPQVSLCFRVTLLIRYNVFKPILTHKISSRVAYIFQTIDSV